MKFDAMHAILAIAFLIMIVSFWSAHKSNTQLFNAFDLIMENGKVSKIAFAFMLVLGVTTWIMIDLQVNGKMSEGYMTTYGAMWVLPLVAKVVFNKTEPPGTTTTTSTAILQETTERAPP